MDNIKYTIFNPPDKLSERIKDEKEEKKEKKKKINKL